MSLNLLPVFSDYGILLVPIDVEVAHKQDKVFWGSTLKFLLEVFPSVPDLVHSRFIGNYLRTNHES